MPPQPAEVVLHFQQPTQQACLSAVGGDDAEVYALAFHPLGRDHLDVVCDQAHLEQCVFYRLHLEAKGKMTLNEGRSNMYSVWGDDRISGEIEL
jgi:hypothetical protein